MEPTRLTKEDREIIRNTFKGNDTLLKTIRKMFIYEWDADAGFFGSQVSPFLNVSTENKSDQEIARDVITHQKTIATIESGLTAIALIAKTSEEDIERIKDARAKNSNK